MLNILNIFLTLFKEIPAGRKLFYFIIIPLVMFAMYASDPDVGIIHDLPFGTNLVNILLILIPVFLFYAVLHLGRKVLTDYVKMGKVYEKAMETPQGAGLVFIGMGLVLIALAIVILAATSGYVKMPV